MVGGAIGAIDAANVEVIVVVTMGMEIVEVFARSLCLD